MWLPIVAGEPGRVNMDHIVAFRRMASGPDRYIIAYTANGAEYTVGIGYPDDATLIAAIDDLILDGN